ncbi:hypothetical protein HDU98_006073, partial [Podochytrium sp. JEL0797]
NLVLLPTAYFAIIPAVIENAVQNAGTTATLPTINAVLQSLAVKSFTNDSFSIQVAVSVGAVSIFPISAGVGAFRVNLVDETSNQLIAISIPDITIPSLSQPFNFNSTFTITFDTANIPVVAALVTNATQTLGDSLFGRTFTARFNVPVKLFGITIYSGLPLFKTISIQKPTGPPVVANSTMTSDMLTKLMNFVSAPANPALSMLTHLLFEFSHLFQSTANQLVSTSLPQELISLPLNGTLTPIAAFTDLAFQVTDTGLSVTLSLNLNNPTVISFNGFNSIEFGINVQGTSITRVAISGVALNPGLQVVAIKTELAIVTTNPAAFVKALSDAADKALMGGQGLVVGIVGPIVVNPMAVVQQITQNLQLNVNAGSLLSSLPSTGSGNSSATSGGGSALQNGKINVVLDSTSVTANARLSVSRPAPLPAKITFPYPLGASLSSQSVPIMSFSVSPLIVTADQASVGLSSALKVGFVNTVAAATALGGAINPILSSPSKDSSIDLTNLAIFKDASATTQFAWTQTLFGAGASPLKINVPAGTINLASLLSSGGGALSSVPVSVQNLKISQLANGQGFAANGSLAMMGLTGVPPVSINLGFGSLDISASNVKFATALLPNGVQISNTSTSSVIPVTAQLNLPSNNLGQTDPALQAVANALTQPNAPASVVGVGGIVFGASQQAAIITLSKVQVSVSTDILKTLITFANAKKPPSMAKRLANMALVTLQSASVKLLSASSISLAANANVMNPTAFSASIGSIQLSASLNQKPLAAFTLGALNLQTGMNANLSSTPADPAVIQSLNAFVGNAVGALGSKAASSNFSSVTVGVSGFAVVTGNSATDVTLFKNVMVQLALVNLLPASNSATVSATIPSAMMVKMKRANTVNAVVDFGALLPNTTDTAALLKSFQFKLASVDVAAAPSATFQVGVTASYNNPLPVTVLLPFLSASVAMDGVANAFTASVSNLALAPGPNTVSPAVSIAFSKDPNLQASLASLVSSVMSGAAPKNSLAVTSLTFGGSVTDKNMFLSNVNFDATPVLAMIKIPANSVSALVGVKLPATLSTLMGVGGGMAAVAAGVQVGAVKVMAMPGKAVAFSTTVMTQLPFNAKINIGYMNVGASVNGNQMVNLQTGFVSNAAGQNGSVSLGVTANLQFQDDMMTQSAVAKLVNNFVAGNMTGSSVGVGNFSIGVSQADSINFLSKVALSQPVDSIVSPSGPLDVTKMLTTTKTNATGAPTNFQIQNTTVTMAAGKQLQVNTLVNVALPFVSSASVPAIAANVGLDTVPMIKTQINGLSVNSGSVGVGAILAFQDSDAISAKVSSLVQQFNAKQPLSGNVVLSGAAFGASQVDLINTFSQVAIPISLQGAAAQASGAGVALPTLNNFAVKIGGVNVTAQPGGVLGFQASAGVANIPLTVSIPFSSIAAGLDNVDVVTSQQAILAQSGSSNVNLAATATFPSNAAVQSKVAAFANTLITKGIGANQESFSVSGVKFGASATDAVTMFSGVRVMIPSSMLLNQKTVGSVSAAIAPNVKLPATFNALATAVTPKNSTMNFQLGSVNLTAQAGKSVGLKTSVGMTLPFPVSVNVGFVNVGATVTGNQLVNFQTSLASMPGQGGSTSFNINALLQFVDGMATQQAVATLANNFLAGNMTGSTVGIANFSIGVSSTDAITTFSQVAASAAVDNIVLPNGPIDVTKLLANQGTAAPNTAAKFQLQNAELTMAAGKQVNLNAKASIGLAFAASANIPAIAANLGIDNVPMVKTQVNGLSVNAGAAAIGVTVAFQDSDAISGKINNLVKQFNARQPLSGAAVVSGAAFGASQTDLINSFAQVAIPINLQGVAQIAAQPTTAGGNGTVNAVQNLGFKLGSATLTTQAGKALGLQASAGVANVPLTVNIPFSSVTAGLDDVDIVTSQQGISAKAGNGTINLAATATFPSSPTIQSKVVTFANTLIAKGVGANQENFAVSGVKFGVSAADSVMMFSGVRVMIPSAMLLNAQALGAIPMTTLANALTVKSANLDLGTAKVISAAAMVGLAGFNMNVNANIGYIGVAASLDNNTIAQVAVPGTTVQSNVNALMFGINAQVSLQDNPKTQASVANIANKFLAAGNKTTTPTTVGANNFAIGLSPTDFIDTFAKISFSLPADALIQSVKTMSANMTTAANAIQVTNSDVSVASATTLAANFAANIGNLLPGANNFNVNLPFIGAQVMLNGQNFIVPMVQGFKLSNGTASAGAMLTFAQNDALLNQVANAAAFVVVPTIQLPANFNPAIMATGTGIVFGASQQDAFAIASKVTANVDVAAMLKAMAAAPAAATPLNPTINVVARNVGVVANVSLAKPVVPFPFTNRLGDIMIGVSYDVGGNPNNRVDIVTPMIQALNLAATPSTVATNVKVGDNQTVWNEIIGNAVGNKSVTTNFYLSGIKINGQGNQGATFMALSNFKVKAPPVIANVNQLAVNLGLKNLLSPTGLNVQVIPQLKAANTMMLTANLGTLDLMLNDATGSILHATSPGPLTLQNSQNGGQLTNNAINANIPIDLNPLTLVARVGELLNPAKNFKFAINMNADDGKIQWLSNILTNAPAALLNNLPQLLAGALKGKL